MRTLTLKLHTGKYNQTTHTYTTKCMYSNTSTKRMYMYPSTLHELYVYVSRYPRTKYMHEIICICIPVPSPSSGPTLTGTQPDYLENRLTKKWGALREKLQKSRNSRWMSGGGVTMPRAWWQDGQIHGVLESNTNAQGLSLLSQLLRSPWCAMKQNCCSFLRSL